MLVDSFIFFNELDVLEIRLETLWDKVDKFILVEAAQSFQGNPKPLYFELNQERFKKYLKKIKHIVVHDFPVDSTPFEREHLQRQAILGGIKNDKTGLFMLSDVDEIPNPASIPNNLTLGKIGLFNQKQYYYKLNYQCVELKELPCTLIVNLENIESPDLLRKRVFLFHERYLSEAFIDPSFLIIPDGGWHFSFLGVASHIALKIESFAHEEFNLPEFKSANYIADCISKGKDLFCRNLSYRIAESDDMPEYIKLNKDYYIKLGLLVSNSNSVIHSNQTSLINDLTYDNEPNEIIAERRLSLIRTLNDAIQNLESWNKNLQKIIHQRDAQIIDLQDRAQSTISARDNQIIDLMADIERVSKWALDLKHQYDQKHSELMKMSDWAASMRLELEKRSLSIKFQCKSLIKLIIKRIFSIFKIIEILTFVKQARLRSKKNKMINALKANLRKSDGRLIIVFPIIVWDFRWQRPQHLISRFSKRGYTILYSAMSPIQNGNLFTSRFEAFSKITLDKLQNGVYQFWPSSNNQINIYQDQLRDDDLKNIIDGIAALILNLNAKSISYLVHFPGWRPIVEKLQSEFGGKIIFDCMDDHGGFSTNSISTVEEEKKLIEKTDLLITSSQLLYDKMSKKNSNCIQVKNGTEFDHFNRCMPNGKLDFLHSSPIIGYFGAISDWFDVDLLAYCARNRPQYNFVLIGSTFGADITTIDKIENIFLLGEKTYQSLPGYLAYFDVCLIPFKLIPLTMATNPVKFYEYLSAGKPVVSVMLPELTEYADYCYLANNYEEFLIQIDDAYQSKDDLKLINMRLDLARNNSWDSRVDVILKNSCFK